MLQVHEGQELAVVEAMKMQNSLHAGLSGTVRFFTGIESTMEMSSSSIKVISTMLIVDCYQKINSYLFSRLKQCTARLGTK